MLEKHWPAVQSIYAAGIATGHATFASAPPNSWYAWQDRHLNEFSVVAEHVGGDEAPIMGWAALAAVSGRCVYAGVAEVSIYVAPAAQGCGVGRMLLAEVIRRSEAGDLWTLQAGIFPENAASLALHRVLGFLEVGVRRGLGRMSFGPMAGRWRDVLLLERRSAVVGID
jgi:phosphinothricin acetyltransferase